MKSSKKAVKVKEAKRLTLEVKDIKAYKITKENVSNLVWDAVVLDVLNGGEEEDGIKELIEYAKSINDAKLRQEVIEIITSDIDSILTGIEYTVDYVETVKEELNGLL